MNHDISSAPEAITIVHVMGPVIPTFLRESSFAVGVLQKIASSKIPVYVAVPPKMVVLERWPSFRASLNQVHRLARGYQEQVLAGGGEAIVHAVVGLDIRFLQLDEASVLALCNELKGAAHWFRGGALCARDDGVLIEAGPGPGPGARLMCVRPVDWIRTNLPPMPLISSAEYEVKFDLTNIFIDDRRLEELREAAGRLSAHDDVHLIAKSMPALFHLYRVAKHYSISLADLRRGNAPKDKERLDALRANVGASLQDYGSPFHTKMCLDICFRIIDPKHVWARGAGATSFDDAYHKLLARDPQFKDEASLSVALRVLIMAARNSLANRGQKDVVWPKSHAGIANELARLGFRGSDLTLTLAKIFREKAQKG